MRHICNVCFSVCRARFMGFLMKYQTLISAHKHKLSEASGNGNWIISKCTRTHKSFFAHITPSARTIRTFTYHTILFTPISEQAHQLILQFTYFTLYQNENKIFDALRLLHQIRLHSHSPAMDLYKVYPIEAPQSDIKSIFTF